MVGLTRISALHRIFAWGCSHGLRRRKRSSRCVELPDVTRATQPSKTLDRWGASSVRATLLIAALILLTRGSFGWAASSRVVVEEDNVRLSQILRSPSLLGKWRQSYSPGLSVFSVREAALQEPEKTLLLTQLGERSLRAAANPGGALRLSRLIQAMPRLGRLVLASHDPYWLEFNPSSDPILQRGDAIQLSPRPEFVTVLLGSGEACHVGHRPTALVVDYVKACNERFPGSLRWVPLSSTETFWLVQPSGRVTAFDESAWLDPTQQSPAAGAWIWAPSTSDGFTAEFSSNIANLMASQGPAGPSALLGVSLPLVELKISDLEARPPALQSTSNDWGTLGYLQMPSARIQEGAIRFGFSKALPYTRYNLMLSPLPWLEFGFRYSITDNRRYSPYATFSTIDHTDKSIDAKFRLLQEGPWLPEVAVGLVDGGGTGLFTSEYVVASKRVGDFDLSLGAGFGYLAGSSGRDNPFTFLGSKFKARQLSAVGEGGTPALDSWFTGPMGLFAGLQWRSPVRNLFVKAEIDSNDYQREPQGNNQPHRSPLNMALVYKPYDWTEFSLGWERGDVIQLGLALSLGASGPAPRKTMDPPPSQWVQGESERGRLGLASGLSQVTLWGVESVSVLGETAYVRLVGVGGYFEERLDRANQFLHLALPATVSEIVYQVVPAGLPLAEVRVNRGALASSLERYRSPREDRIEPVARVSAGVSTNPRSGVDWAWSNLRFSPGLHYGHVLGGPNAFWLYRVSAAGHLRWQPRDDTWFQGRALYRMIDNMDSYQNNSFSLLPKVRTNLRDYHLESRFTLPVMQLTHVGQVTPLGGGHFYSIYGGYLERMFGGLGAEYLYRPIGGSMAFGLDMNRVG